VTTGTETVAFRMQLHRGQADHGLDALPAHPVMRRWWAMMADLMDTHPDNAPVQVALTEMFRLR
jgi:L-rhamnose mutarotase